MSGLDTKRAKQLDFKRLAVPQRWCVHSYYTLNPYAPDGSGRLLLAGCVRDTRQTEVLILSAAGEVINRIPGPSVYESFWHTGLWQSWSSDGKCLYFQDGSLTRPVIARVDLLSGQIQRMPGGMEGCLDEPIISTQLGMLYAAGYGTGVYNPELSPVPFPDRTRHGLFSYNVKTRSSHLALSTEDVLQRHPNRDRLRRLERDFREMAGMAESLTLMLYCVRWNQQGTRLLFYFGNHCVVGTRAEPRLSYVFTSDRDLKEIHLAADLSSPRKGVHWSWHPDGEHLIGYGSAPNDEARMCLVSVLFDGSEYRQISRHCSGGHPSISPTDPNLLVTDENELTGNIVFIDLRRDKAIAIVRPGRVLGNREEPGRNPYRVCHHPVFSRDGTKVLANSLSEENAAVCEIQPPMLQ